MDPEQLLSLDAVLALSPEARTAYLAKLSLAECAVFDRAVDEQFARLHSDRPRLERASDAGNVQRAIDAVDSQRRHAAAWAALAAQRAEAERAYRTTLAAQGWAPAAIEAEIERVRLAAEAHAVAGRQKATDEPCAEVPPGT
jgi:hypothetical protein